VTFAWSIQADEPAKAGKAKNEVSLKVASWADAQKIVAQQKGKVVVLDLWSTSCVPCVKEFPNLVKLQQDHPQDVVCISFNTNYYGAGAPEDEQEEVLKFLSKQNAHLINLLSSEADEDLYKRIGIASIPVVQVYGRDGKLARQFDNEKDEYGKDGFTYEKNITPFVNKLVESK
jgi:thiol-disulfide isomerase/thioredoxin